VTVVTEVDAAATAVAASAAAQRGNGGRISSGLEERQERDNSAKDRAVCSAKDATQIGSRVGC